MVRYTRPFLLLLFVFACCSATPAGSADRKISISLGVLPVIDTLPLVVGVERGFFEEQGLAINLIEFSGALERDVALQSGRIDAYFGDLLNTLLLINSGQRLSLVTTVFRTDRNQRMFALLASPRSGITNLKQIGEAPVAISRASVAEYVLDRIMAQASVRRDKIKKIEVRAIPIRYQMLMANEIKLALLPEPLALKAESEGARVLADDRTLDATLTVVAFKTELLRDHQGLSGRFIAAYGKAVQAVNANPDAYKDLLVEKTQFPSSLKERFTVPSFPNPEKPRKKDVESIEDWLLEKGLMTKSRPYETVVAP
jgi:NitT/TauT family transport system substrate-binding protein